MPKRFAAGDIFGIPLPDGSFAAGQVLGREREALNSLGCAFFPDRVKAGDPVSLSDPIAVLLVTPDLLNKGIWPVVSRDEPTVLPQDRPYERFRAAKWVGAKIVGSGNLQKLLAAYHGLAAWDDGHDPNYLDPLLLPGVPRPAAAILSGGIKGPAV